MSAFFLVRKRGEKKGSLRGGIFGIAGLCHRRPGPHCRSTNYQIKTTFKISLNNKSNFCHWHIRCNVILPWAILLKPRYYTYVSRTARALPKDTVPNPSCFPPRFSGCCQYHIHQPVSGLLWGVSPTLKSASWPEALHPAPAV